MYSLLLRGTTIRLAYQVNKFLYHWSKNCSLTKWDNVTCFVVFLCGQHGLEIVRWCGRAHFYYWCPKSWPIFSGMYDYVLCFYGSALYKAGLACPDGFGGFFGRPTGFLKRIRGVMGSFHSCYSVLRSVTYSASKWICLQFKALFGNPKWNVYETVVTSGVHQALISLCVTEWRRFILRSRVLETTRTNAFEAFSGFCEFDLMQFGSIAAENCTSILSNGFLLQVQLARELKQSTLCLLHLKYCVLCVFIVVLIKPAKLTFWVAAIRFTHQGSVCIFCLRFHG